MFDKPMGGTELMYEELMKRLPQQYKDEFSIFNYAPYADTSKKLVYWNQLSYDQDAVQFLKDPSVVEQIHSFVFVSHWQAECFRKTFNIPGYKTCVIKNACIDSFDKDFESPIEKVKICYTSTPWRGLDILLSSWENLQPENCELHIFSSTKIYGKDFANNAEENYIELYNKAKNIPGIVYRGSIPNKELLKELPSFHIMAYPCTFEETSCIAVIEALSAGLRVVTSNIGALPETTEGWARLYPFLANKEYHAVKFATVLSEEIKNINSEDRISFLKLQKETYAPKWSWNERIKEWINFLDTLTLKQ